jgi:osmotically-inducible protein OsmY
MQDEHSAESTAREIKAAARDMLRVGSRWAHSALDWFDERRHEMNNRTRDEHDHGERGSRHEPYSASQGDWQDRDRSGQQGRQHAAGREQLQGRSDRDIQGDYSGGGYDQVGSREDWSRGSDYGRYGGGREGSFAQSRSRPPDDDSFRGEFNRDLGYGGGYGASSQDSYSGAGYGYGNSAPGGVGYGAPGYGAGSSYGDTRYHGDFQSRSVGEEEGYGSYGRDFGGSRGYESESGRYAQGGGSAQGRRGQESYGAPWRGAGQSGSGRDYSSPGRSSHDELGYGGRGSLSGRSDARSQTFGYGTQGLQGSQSGQAGRSYRGLGPRNYTRSDERIREDLNERLTEAHDIDASDITVEVSNGVATLSGRVEERWMKHRAEDIADGCTGVRDVHNMILVSLTSSRSGYDANAQSEQRSQYGSSQQSTSAKSGGSSQQSGATTGQQSISGQQSSGSSNLGAGTSSSGSGSTSSSSQTNPSGRSGSTSGSTSTGPNV